MGSLAVLATSLQPLDPSGLDTVTPIAGAAGGEAVNWVPVLLLGVPTGIAILLIWFYARTARQHRRAMLAPPVWLLPYLEHGGSAPASSPPAKFDADHVALEEERLASTAALARRKRLLLAGLGINFVAGWALAGVLLFASSKHVDFEQLPATLVVGPSVDEARFEGLEDRAPEARPGEAASPVIDTAAERIRRAQQAAFIRRRDSLLAAERADSVALADAIARRVRDSMVAVLQDSLARVRASVPAVAVAPPPPPPPPAPPAPDPVRERERALAVIDEAGARLIAAVNARDDALAMVSPGSARDRLLQFVREQGPSADRVSLDVDTADLTRLVAILTVQFQWRGSFGDTRRRAARFQLEATRAGEAWVVSRLVPLDNLP